MIGSMQFEVMHVFAKFSWISNFRDSIFVMKFVIHGDSTKSNHCFIHWHPHEQNYGRQTAKISQDRLYKLAVLALRPVIFYTLPGQQGGVSTMLANLYDMIYVCTLSPYM